MIAANTTRPIARPAQPGAALRWMTPKTANTRRKVPTNSAKNAWYHGVVAAYDATPRPSSLAFWPSTPTISERTEDRAEQLGDQVAGHLASTGTCR